MGPMMRAVSGKGQGGIALIEAVLAVFLVTVLMAHFLSEYTQRLREAQVQAEVSWAIAVAQAAATNVQQMQLPQTSMTIGSSSTTAETVPALQSLGYLPISFSVTPPSGSALIAVRNEGPVAKPVIGVLVVTGVTLPTAVTEQIVAMHSSDHLVSVVRIPAGQDSFVSQEGIQGRLSDFGLAPYADPAGSSRIATFAWTN